MNTGVIATVVGAIAGVASVIIGIVSLVPQSVGNEPTEAQVAGPKQEVSSSGEVLPEMAPDVSPPLEVLDASASNEELDTTDPSQNSESRPLTNTASAALSCDGVGVVLQDGLSCYSRTANSMVSVNFSIVYGRLRPTLTVSPDSGEQVVQGFVGPGQVGFADGDTQWVVNLISIDTSSRSIKIRLSEST